MKGYLEELNQEQLEAVEAIDGPVLVLAGAGSGKTRVITSRIIHLLFHHEIPEYRILAMTFTNKAAQEMKERVRSALDQEVMDLTISTFHSFCARFLRREIDHLDRDKNFGIFDAQDQVACIKKVVKRLNLREKDFPPAALRNRFSRLKNFGELDATPEDPTLRTIFLSYQQEMEAQNAVDFDDLLLLSCDILNRFPNCRRRYSDRFQYLLVDEYQDTNRAQFMLLKHLTEIHGNICVVGDEDQSIYGWRGAEIRNILDFEEHFPDTRIFQLEQNYRSTQSILDYANQAISANVQRHEKRLWTDLGAGEAVQIRSFFRETYEARFIAETVMRIHEEDDEPWSSFAVLFRANYLSRNLEEAFRKCDIPFQLVGGVKFYERKEIKDLLSYMRICVNPGDWTAFSRALTTPPRGIGAKSLEILSDEFRSSRDVFKVMDRVVEKKLLGGKRGTRFDEFRNLVLSCRDEAHELPPSQWLQHLIERLDYKNYLEKLDEVAAEFRVANIDELIVGLQEMERQGLTNLAEFMDFCALISDQDSHDKSREKVSLMTVHAAKGLEFNNVFVMGLEDGIFPNQRSLAENPNALEEERRLFYVALTRAKKRLCLTHAHRRQTFGSISTNSPSRFLRSSMVNASKPAVQGDIDRQLTKMEAQLRMRDVQVEFPRRSSDPINAGDMVRHPSFGVGRVVNTSGRGMARKVGVYFQGVGIKKFVWGKAKLEKVSPEDF